MIKTQMRIKNNILIYIMKCRIYNFHKNKFDQLGKVNVKNRIYKMCLLLCSANNVTTTNLVLPVPLSLAILHYIQFIF